ncbi:class I SAM-dependent methyltransferase [Candidatus Woesearchaeota archaeon]|jgi:ubiquinone biosynthesis O-methyltransferase|nr:class I SAM-dependent methyltransferase [Candidatus Woesearchaeota archaeon]MBT3304755.1 class I SAM-dependent methyltransferase [Candidatus Woesearchaeota archaeon]MBT4367909.1 class I SAM-dependent methyltransferase [Candidatus Woesearchaeota archaeon]MBT4712397.1 class I SAM-dependent methyltransferase [Candidatus Woesearchaeota archaeon]MBT6639309.1 class I SAM-dependent methyltransferase [Candidatus Woesearchaeota archaeon]
MVKIVSVKEAYKQWAHRYDKDLQYLFESEEEKILPLIGNVKGKQVLDLGCGTGRYSVLLAKRGAIVTAIDFSEEMIEVAKTRAKKEGVRINFIVLDIRKKLPVLEKFDLILSMLVLNHFKHPNLILNKVNKALKLGGEYIISTPHVNKGKTFALVQSLGLDAKKYQQTKEEYLDWFKKSNFIIKTYLEVKFSKKAVLHAEKDGIDLKPYANKPFLMVFKIKKLSV